MPASIDLSGIRNAQALIGLRQKQVETIVKRARATLSRRLLVEARRDIQTEYSLSAARIRSALNVRNSGEVVELTASGRGVGLINYPNSGGRRRREFKVEVKRGEGKRPWDDGSFIGTALGGSLQAFVRDPTERPRRMTRGSNAGKIKQPLARQYGPSVAQMLRRPERLERLAEFGRGLLRDEIDRQVR